MTMAKAGPATSGPIRRAPGLAGPKLILFSLMVAGAGGLVGFEISREAAPATPSPATNRLALPTPRPALGRDEQAYIEELWPVHTAVERTAVRVALGASFYKLNDLNRTDLKVRLADAVTAFRPARGPLRAHGLSRGRGAAAAAPSAAEHAGPPRRIPDGGAAVRTIHARNVADGASAA